MWLIVEETSVLTKPACTLFCSSDFYYYLNNVLFEYSMTLLTWNVLELWYVGIRIRITATTSFYFSVLKDTFIIRNSKYLNCVPNVPVTVENKNLKHYFLYLSGSNSCSDLC